MNKTAYNKQKGIAAAIPYIMCVNKCLLNLADERLKRLCER